MGETPYLKNFWFFTFTPFSCLYSNTVSPSLFLRYKSVPNSMQVRFIGWEKNGSCIDFGRELLGRSKDDDVFNAKMQRRREFFEHGKHGINDFFLVNHRSHRLEGFSRLRSWLKSLRSLISVVLYLHDSAPKGQKHIAQGNALWYYAQ